MSKTYRGVRKESRRGEVRVNDVPLPSQKTWQWSYKGRGPSALAEAIADDLFQIPPYSLQENLDAYSALIQIIAELPNDDWVLSEDEIHRRIDEITKGGRNGFAAQKVG